MTNFLSVLHSHKTSKTLIWYKTKADKISSLLELTIIGSLAKSPLHIILFSQYTEIALAFYFKGNAIIRPLNCNVSVTAGFSS